MNYMTTHGPIFRPGREEVVDHVLSEAERETAERGVNMIRTALGEVLRHPTGYYQSQIQTERAFGSTLITDGDVIYGPWLEGTGSRNRTTRFKGYATFRRTAQLVQEEAYHSAEEAANEIARRLS